jgi:hypothetical protein
MQSNDSALRGTGAAPELWGAAYMMLVFALFSRAVHAWLQFSGQPIDWQQALAVGFGILMCPAPLLLGIAFRKLIKSELSRNQLSQRTFKICNFWIPQLIILAYLTMVV